MSYLKEMADQGYSPKHIGTFHNVMIPWLLNFHKISKKDVIVDIGAAQGHALIPIYNNGWRKLIAIDIENENFSLFSNKYNIRTIKCDIEYQSLNEIETSSVGAVLAFHLLEHLRSPNNFLSETYRILKTGSKFFMVTPDWRKQYKTFWRDPTHIHPYDKEAIVRICRMSGFKIIKLSSWNARFGLGLVKAYRLIPCLGMIGKDILCVCSK